jgi:tetratricopeptide (TPR) repeat protein
LKSDYTIAYIYRGFCYDKQNNKLRDADFQKGISLNPKLAYETRGELYRKQTRLKEATYDYTKLIELDPTNTSAYVERSQLYIGLKEYNLALIDVNSITSLDPTTISLNLLRGDIYLDTGKFINALSQYDTVLKLQPQNAYAHNARGNLFAKLRRYDSAIENFENALEYNEIKEFTGAVYFNIAQCNELKGNKQEALKYYQLASQNGLFPRNPNSKLKLIARLNGEWSSFTEWL